MGVKKCKHMKTIKKYLIAIVLLLPVLTSCRLGLEELPSWDQAEMTKLVFERREMGKTADGIDVVKYINVPGTFKVIKVENGVTECEVTVPVGTKLTELVGIATISTAARIIPVDGSPVLGKPGDFTNGATYKVIAADNVTVKVYSVKVVVQ